MKKIIIAALFLTLSGISYADGHGHHHGGGYHYRGGGGGWNWVAPLIIGGVAGAIIYDAYNRPMAQQPVCPYGQAPMYNRMITVDPYGRQVESYQFVGCR